MVENNLDKRTEHEVSENGLGTESKESTKLSVEELTDLLKRTQANFENYRKQNQAYVEEIKKMAARDVIAQILPILDNFELALKTVLKEQANTEFVQGITLIHSQVLQLLQHNNVVPIEAVGKDFDPYYHEALVKVPSEVPANRIIEEFQKGFTMHGKVLRHAKVKVSAGSQVNFNQDNQNKNESNHGSK